ncbi:TetR/AcrR family transcriptional regulator [Gordonia sp. X0973]|uniref:TetR/AcrR family transcriptional regulator n=1 Tax=Gordonia sp. X0973 TaxID=2742602 RepID=UPI000F52A9EF|nr:TetR/AcrR family transcriptional regulator [Gordonia sp. X0973]QKT06490.1 TetR/AcrR family transcriptional regulator [Gordonia sp. X0973]
MTDNQPARRTYRGETAAQRAQDRRRRLIDAAVEVFGTRGYRVATVDEVCTQAGLSKRYFYESFTDAEALLLACYEKCAQDIHTDMVAAVVDAPPSMDEQLRAALTGYFCAIEADQRRARITLLEILGVSPAVDAAYTAQTHLFAASVQALAPAAFGSADDSDGRLHLIAQGIIGAVTTLARIWLLDEVARPRAELVDAAYALVNAVLDDLSGHTAGAG